jgi:hypothetical protein
LRSTGWRIASTGDTTSRGRSAKRRFEVQIRAATQHENDSGLRDALWINEELLFSDCTLVELTEWLLVVELIDDVGPRRAPDSRSGICS